MADVSTQVRVFDLFKKRALVTRESARAFQSVLQPLFREGKSEFVLDFAGVEAVTPSFVDELIGLVEESLSNKQQQQVRILFLHAPTRLSEKFAAVARARNVLISELDQGAWEVLARNPSRNNR